MILITFKYRHRKQIIIAFFLSILIISISITGVIKYRSSKKKDIKNKIITTSTDKKDNLLKKDSADSKKVQPNLLKIDIKGEIINPGLYTLEEGSRVIDAIELAGGLTENANTTVINLSKKIIDEMVIIVYSNQEVADFKTTKELEQKTQESCLQKDENSLKNGACITNKEVSSTKISINSASLEELQTLSGIGEAKAQDIIAYREANGPFQAIADIQKVPGIGEALFAKIKENITI